MDRSAVVIVVAIALAGFGLLRLLELLPLVAAGFTEWGSFAGRAAQCAFALLAAAGIWLRLAWAIPVVWLLAFAVAATALYEAFVPGILAPLHAVVIRTGSEEVSLVRSCATTSLSSVTPLGSLPEYVLCRFTGDSPTAIVVTCCPKHVKPLGHVPSFAPFP